MKKIDKLADFFIKKKTKSRAYKVVGDKNKNNKENIKENTKNKEAKLEEEEEEEDETEKLKKGLEVHFSVKAIRTTQLPVSENGTKVHVLYGHGKDCKKDRAQSEERVIDDRICIWEKEVKPYEFTVVLIDELQTYSEIKEIDWKPHPVYFSLRKHHILTDKEIQEKKLKDEKFQEQKEKEIEKIEKEIEKRKKKGKSTEDLELKLQETEENFSISSDEEEKLFFDIIGTKVQLDLVDYCEHGSNTMEAFGVPNPKPEKGSDEESSESDDEKPKPPPSIAFKIVVNIQSRWLRYLGRKITNDLTVEGEKVNIHGTEWIYLDPPLTDKPKKMKNSEPENLNANKEFLAMLGEDDKKGKSFTSVLSDSFDKDEEEGGDRSKSKKEVKDKKRSKKEEKELKKQQEKQEKEERMNRLQKEEEERRKREAEEEELIREDIEISKHLKQIRDQHEEETKLLEKERLRREKEDEKILKKDINIRNSLKPQTKKDKNHRRSFSLTSTSDSEDFDSLGKKKSSVIYTNEDSRDEFGLFEQKKLPSQQAKRKCKLDFIIQLLAIRNLPEKHNGKVFFLSWMRGSNKSGESARVVCENTNIEFDDSQNKPIQLTCTFTQLPKKTEFEKKTIAFALKEDNTKKSLYTSLVDLATFSVGNINRELELPLNSSKDPPMLMIRILTKQAFFMEAIPSMKNSISLNPLNFTSSPLSVLFIMQLKEFICADKSDIQNDVPICIQWKRGSKEKNKGISSPIMIQNGKGIWVNEPPAQLTCTMMKKSKKSSFQSKKLSVAIVTPKRKIIKKLAVNLAEYSEQNFSKEISFFFKGVGILSLQMNTKWRAIGGKKLIEATADNLNDLKPSVEISGVNYQLVTSDDISEISEIDSEKVETDSEEDLQEEVDEIFKEENDNEVDYANYSLKLSGPNKIIELRNLEEKYERVNFRYESFLAENQFLSEELQFLRSNPDNNSLMKRVEKQLSLKIKENETVKREYSFSQKNVRTKLQKKERKYSKSVSNLHSMQGELQSLHTQFDSIYKEKQTQIGKLASFYQQVQSLIDPLVKNVKTIGNPDYYKKLQEIIDYNSQQNEAIQSQLKKFNEISNENKKIVSEIEEKVIKESQDFQSQENLIHLETKADIKYETLLFIHSNIYTINIKEESDPRNIASRLFNEIMRRKSPAFLGKIFQSIYAPVKVFIFLYFK